MFTVVRISWWWFCKIMCDSSIFSPTGQPGWGIAWYIDGLLVPQLTLTRGQTYTFRAFGGDNDNIVNRATYHPFYITDSKSGGRLLNSQAQRMVTQQTIIIHMFVSLVYRMRQCMQASMVINLLEVRPKSTNWFLF